VIEFSHASGLIKCAQNPQLYFHMSEVIEKKRLELNEKVEFSVVPVSPGPPGPVTSLGAYLNPLGVLVWSWDPQQNVALFLAARDGRRGEPGHQDQALQRERLPPRP